MYGHTALILGAGFSKSAGGPLLRELLTHDVVAYSEAQLPALAAISSVVQGRQSVEDGFTRLWIEARTGGSVSAGGEIWSASELLDQLLVHLASVCGRIHLRRSGRLYTSYNLFFDDLFRNSRSLTVITFNYDMLVEQILDDLNLRFDYGSKEGIRFDNPHRRSRLSRADPQVRIMKLHGSASWGICRGCTKSGRALDLVTAFDSAYVPNRRKRCPVCWRKYLQSGIIPPILGKAGEARHEEPIWKEARKALRRAREIIVIGYSLPASDVEAISLLREVRFLGRRPRIRIACGPRGAPSTYDEVFSRFNDTKMLAEELLSSWS